MRLIDVQINKAVIESFLVNISEDNQLEVSATIGLIGPNGKRISTFSTSTGKYVSNPFNLPIEMIEPIRTMAGVLEGIVVAQCNRALNLLPDPNKIEVKV
jgi:hypothetical protein